jgi:formylglycine-generating enzyme required for sulfatase activity
VEGDEECDGGETCTDECRRFNAGIDFIQIPGGTFTMGSPPDEEGRFEDEGPQHDVTISAFELGKTEVTNAQYAQFLHDRPTVERPPGWSDNLRGDEPVGGVTWDEAKQFAQWAGGRLPTEAEWEYAARAGSSASRYGSLDDIAWYSENSGSRKHPVGQKEANEWGLHDLLGNLYEWCSDRYGPYSSSSLIDPSGPTEGENGVLRGGSYKYGAGDTRAAVRIKAGPGFRDDDNGFRVARNRTGSAE